MSSVFTIANVEVELAILGSATDSASNAVQQYDDLELEGLPLVVGWESKSELDGWTVIEDGYVPNSRPENDDCDIDLDLSKFTVVEWSLPSDDMEIDL